MRFSLLAPRCRSVALRGSFNGWSELPMERQDDGRFVAEIDLPDGSYEYDFIVERQDGGRVAVEDPRATCVDGRSRHAKVLVRGGRPATDGYRWRHDHVPLPQDRDLVLYELLVPDFSGGDGDEGGGGRFADVIAKLDHLQRLGVNAIELLPVMGTRRGHHWGYLVRQFFAVEPDYGGGEDLKRLVDECHARGMRVMLDVVYNHADEDCPLVRIDKTYWFHEHRRYEPENYWGPEFNYGMHDEERGTRPAWDFMADVHRHWIQCYHIDGMRYDALKELRDRSVMRRFAELAREWAGPKPFYNIGEHMPENPEIAGPDKPMDACWHDAFRSALKELLVNGNFDRRRMSEAVDPRRQGFPSALNVVNCLATHDTDHLLADLFKAGVDADEAFARARLGMAILMTAMGVPMIWMGDEYGDTNEKDLGPRKLRWSLMRDARHRAFFEHVRSLVRLRHERPALRGDDCRLLMQEARDPLLCYARGGEGAAIVVANCGARELRNYELHDLPAAGDLAVFGSHGRVRVESGRCRVDMQPWSALILLAGD